MPQAKIGVIGGTGFDGASKRGFASLLIPSLSPYEGERDKG